MRGCGIEAKPRTVSTGSATTSRIGSDSSTMRLTKEEFEQF
jgi:hypothetical protein